MNNLMKKTLMILSICILFFSCDLFGSKEDEESGPAEPGQVGAYPNTANYVNPFVIIDDSPGFTVTDGGLVRSYSTSSYMYGTLKVKYTGDDNLKFVNAYMKFMDEDEDILYTDSTYIDNEGFVDLSSVSTDTYLTPQYNEGVLKMIEDLSDYSIELSHIYSIAIKFSYITFTTEPVIHSPLQRGTVIHPSNDVWDLPVTNMYDKPLSVYFVVGLLSDLTGRIGYWTYGSLHEYDGTEYSHIDSVIDPGQSANIHFWESTPDYLSGSLSLDSAVLGCDLPTDSDSAIAFSTAFKAGAMSVDELNSALHRARDEALRALERSLE